MKKLLVVIVGALVALALAATQIVPLIIERSMNLVANKPLPIISDKARALHQDLFIVDLHTDSLLWDRDLAQESNYGHVDLPRLQQGNVGLQVFSATTKSPRGQNYAKNAGDTDNITLLTLVQAWPPGTWFSLYQRASYQLDKLLSLQAANPEKLHFIRSQKDLQMLLKARQSNPSVVGSMYLIEGAHPLEGKLENLAKLHRQGLHFVGLTHFFDNRLGGSLHGISQQGLTDFGRQVIGEVDRLKMNVDIAHASPQMVRDVLALSERPVILSHGGFKGHCDSARNLDDQLMQSIAAKGGLIGVGFWDGAICDASPLGIVKAIRYGINLLGLEHIALGSDYDGSIEAYFDISNIAVLTQTMLDEGFTETEIRAVMGGNARDFLLAQLPLN